MYTLWKRTAPPASLATFDAPDREKCTARRAQTNTPLQALVLLNDPTYVEASRVLAQRAHARRREGSEQRGSRTRSAWRRRASRRKNEIKVLRTLLDGRLDAYRQDRQGALKLLAVGESPRNPRLDVAGAGGLHDGRERHLQPG